MRLTISNDDVLDSSIFGDNNQPLYRVSTNSDNPFNHTTTIRDVNCSDPNTELHLATITRNTTGSDTIRFEGHESVDANDMLSRRWFSTWVFFLMEEGMTDWRTEVASLLDLIIAVINGRSKNQISGYVIL